ncbi:MAG: DUF3105 domain-containing protein [Lapillicoccus sp.]
MAKNTPSRRRPSEPSSGRPTSASSAASGAEGPSDRQAKLADLKTAQKARERRTVLLIVSACAALVLVLGGVITYGVIDGRSKAPANAILSLGVPSSEASCDPVTTDTATGNSDHVGPGTNSPETTTVTYATVPPSSGSHFVQPDISGRGYYTADDSPAVETLVHNLEHGYTVLWYAPAAAGNAAQLRQMAELGTKLDASAGKFIVAPWDASRGVFPAGRNYALVHWSAIVDPATGEISSQAGHRQLCGGLSGEVVSSFVTSHPRTDAPEPFGA